MGTRGAWARDFLVALGNAKPSAKTVNLVAAWTKAENTEAKFNPLATTLNYGTNTKFNSVGVRNYSSRAEGIQATVITLRGNWPGYAKTLKGLQTDDSELALSGMLTPGMPWGTNFGTVASYYRSKDVTGEELRSESGAGSTSSTHTTNKVDDSPIRQGTVTTTDTSIDTMAGMVTEDSVKKYAKILLGSGIGIIGGILILKSMISFDAVKLAAKVATI